jgi:hypothetical protein
MNETVAVSWEWIIGTIVTLIVAFLAWVAKQIYDIKTSNEQRLRFLENENASQNKSIETLERITLKPFEKEVKKK